MFDYHEAFSRNLGWITDAEQDVLRSRRIAIAGLGGVGGSHLLTLTRLGIGHFHIADLDRFELANFNRQAGANVASLERSKLDVMTEMATAINPEAKIRGFDNGVSLENLDDFLEGVDLYVDALDFFAFDIRRAVFAACAERDIPAITAAPLGMGAALLCFTPDSMSFDDYFQMAGQPEQEQALRFMLGLAPSLAHMRYLVDDTRVDFESGKGPSTPMACEMCAGIAGTQALKLLLHRGDVITAPRGIHYDAYRNKVNYTWRPWGNANPIQKLGLSIARKRVMAKRAAANSAEGSAALPDTPAVRVLNLARWAPSGDNDQPWRFELTGEHSFTIHGRDTRDWCLYDLDGRSSQLAIGALLETATIAAAGEGCELHYALREGLPEETPTIDVRLVPHSAMAASPLAPFIKSRVTQRRPFSRKPLTQRQKKSLEAAVGDGYQVRWVESDDRGSMARLLFNSAHIRLSTKEGFEVHRNTIEWGVQFSETRIPEPAVGADKLTLVIMRWALQSWGRIKFLNRFFAGTWLPRLQMDLATGYACAAHFLIVADHPLETVEDHLSAGAAMQRFWLQATRLGLLFQPEMTPLIFSRYSSNDLRFSDDERAVELAGSVKDRLESLVGPVSQGVYMGRVGSGSQPVSRSTRPPLSQLIQA